MIDLLFLSFVFPFCAAYETLGNAFFTFAFELFSLLGLGFKVSFCACGVVFVNVLFWLFFLDYVYKKFFASLISSSA